MGRFVECEVATVGLSLAAPHSGRNGTRAGGRVGGCRDADVVSAALSDRAEPRSNHADVVRHAGDAGHYQVLTERFARSDDQLGSGSVGSCALLAGSLT